MENHHGRGGVRNWGREIYYVMFPPVSNVMGNPAALSPPPFITATGGTITTDGNYKVHTFNSSGTFEVTSGSGNVQYLVVAGGGSSGP